MNPPGLVVAGTPHPASPVTFEGLLTVVDRHIENIACGELAPVFAECNGPNRAELIHTFATLSPPSGSTCVEWVSRRANRFTVRIRYGDDALARVLTTTWVADPKGRLSLVGATPDAATGVALTTRRAG